MVFLSPIFTISAGKFENSCHVAPPSRLSSNLLTAIYNERRIELLGEGRAWADLHRRQLPVPAKVAFAQATVASYSIASGTYPTASIATILYSDFKYLWPIPAPEIANNPTLAKQQNPGW